MLKSWKLLPMLLVLLALLSLLLQEMKAQAAALSPPPLELIQAFSVLEQPYVYLN